MEGRLYVSSKEGQQAQGNQDVERGVRNLQVSILYMQLSCYVY